MPKPTEQILAWIGTLAPAEELAVRMALARTNPWCQEDKPWQLRIAELQAQFIKTDDDRRRYEERAAKMARDFDGAVQEMKAQMSAPAAIPNPSS